MNYPHPQVSGNNSINVFQKNQKESEKKLMMTSLTAVDLFVWHESLEGGRAGARRRARIDVLIRWAGGSYSYYLSWGRLLKVLVWFMVLVLGKSFPSPCQEVGIWSLSLSGLWSWGSLTQVCLEASVKVFSLGIQFLVPVFKTWKKTPVIRESFFMSLFWEYLSSPCPFIGNPIFQVNIF